DLHLVTMTKHYTTFLRLVVCRKYGALMTVRPGPGSLPFSRTGSCMYLPLHVKVCSVSALIQEEMSVPSFTCSTPTALSCAKLPRIPTIFIILAAGPVMGKQLLTAAIGVTNVILTFTCT